MFAFKVLSVVFVIAVLLATVSYSTDLSDLIQWDTSSSEARELAEGTANTLAYAPSQYGIEISNPKLEKIVVAGHFSYNPQKYFVRLIMCGGNGGGEIDCDVDCDFSFGSDDSCGFGDTFSCAFKPPEKLAALYTDLENIDREKRDSREWDRGGSNSETCYCCDTITCCSPNGEPYLKEGHCKLVRGRK